MSNEEQLADKAQSLLEGLESIGIRERLSVQRFERIRESLQDLTIALKAAAYDKAHHKETEEA
jgi:hypothetical protein